jgi:hypothetical protein
LLVVLAGLAVVLAAGAVALCTTPIRSPVTKQKYEQIRVSESDDDSATSMSRSEVEAILGPPGEYTTRPTVDPSLAGQLHDAIVDSRGPTFDLPLDLGVRQRRPSYALKWQGNELTIFVAFDATNRVHTKSLVKNQPADLGPLDALVWHAKRLWHRWFPE